MIKMLAAPFLLWLFMAGQNDPGTMNRKDDGYRGIWYSNQPSNDEYVFKYSGGLGTYPANHYPFSVYAPAVNKTFFCYGGTDSAAKSLLHEVSYFDHATGTVPRPTILLDKKTDDAHDNPVMNIDAQGYIWIFSTSHGVERPSFIHKSTKPYDISHFDEVPATRMENGTQLPLNNFSYLQSWYMPSQGFFNLFTHYEHKVIPGFPGKPRRTISYMTSRDGVSWSEWHDLAAIQEGHYQTSGMYGKKIVTTFNFHPYKGKEAGLNYRSNVYYLQTTDFGKSWQNAAGKTVTLPLKEVNNAALVKDYFSAGLNVYINDVDFDSGGNPVILYITSKGFEVGPEMGPRAWFTARWNKGSWEILPVTVSDNNYDMGSLYVEKDGTWRIIAPTTDGPQKFNTGGEMVMWVSKDKGGHWTSTAMTLHSAFNHSYPRRPVNAHPDFYAFWADGNARKRSVSHLYFANKKGDVFMLPEHMNSDTAHPQRVFPAP